MYQFIDGNSIGYSAQNTRKLSVNGLEIQAVYQSLRILKSIRTNHSTYTKSIWFWDGKPEFRTSLYPEYKANRDDDPDMKAMRDAYHAVRPIIETGLKHLGIDQVTAPHYEADDLAGVFTRRANKQGRKVLLVTGDRDWQQLVNSLTDWHDPRKPPGKYCNRSTFEDVTGFRTTAQFLEAKALDGDASDNIKGINGIGPKACEAIMNEFGSVKGLATEFKKHGEFTKENLPKSLSRYRSHLNRFMQSEINVFTRNYRLMNLQTSQRDADITTDANVIRGEKDISAFKDFCREYQFLSIIKELNRWDELF